MRRIVSWALCLVFVAALALPGFGQTATVTRNVILRADPSTQNDPIELLKPSTKLGVLDLDRTNGYYNVVKANGQEGWVWGNNVEIDENEAFEVTTAVIPAYDRSDWKHWIDADGDCQNTRNEVLVRDSTVPVTFKARADGKQCSVESGRWVDPYSSEVFTEPKKLDIDHFVPLQNAHLSGGWSWDNQKRQDYANNLDDPEHLLAVKASLNRQKGAKGPENWKPPNQQFWCEYGEEWEHIKLTWQLTMTTAEAAAVQELKQHCP